MNGQHIPCSSVLVMLQASIMLALVCLVVGAGQRSIIQSMNPCGVSASCTLLCALQAAVGFQAAAIELEKVRCQPAAGIWMQMRQWCWELQNWRQTCPLHSGQKTLEWLMGPCTLSSCRYSLDAGQEDPMPHPVVVSSCAPVTTGHADTHPRTGHGHFCPILRVPFSIPMCDWRTEPWYSIIH